MVVMMKKRMRRMTRGGMREANNDDNDDAGDAYDCFFAASVTCRIRIWMPFHIRIVHHKPVGLAFTIGVPF